MSVIEGWKEILKLLEDGTAVIIAGGEQYNLPSLHDFYKNNPDKADEYWRTVKHCGFGFFKGHTEHGEFSFDGGGAMRHYSEGIYGEDGYKTLSFSPLRACGLVLEDLEYNTDTVRHRVTEIIATLE